MSTINHIDNNNNSHQHQDQQQQQQQQDNNNNNYLDKLNNTIINYESTIKILKNEIYNLNTYPEDSTRINTTNTDISKIKPTQDYPFADDTTFEEQFEFIQDLFYYLQLTRNSILNSDDTSPKEINYYDACSKCPDIQEGSIVLKHPVSKHPDYHQFELPSFTSHLYIYFDYFGSMDNQLLSHENILEFHKKIKSTFNKYTGFNKANPKSLVKESTTLTEFRIVKHENQFSGQPHLQFPNLKRLNILVYDQALRIHYQNSCIAGFKGFQEPIHSTFNQFKASYICGLIMEANDTIKASIYEYQIIISNAISNLIPTELLNDFQLNSSNTNLNNNNNNNNNSSGFESLNNLSLDEPDPNILALDQFLLDSSIYQQNYSGLLDDSVYGSNISNSSNLVRDLKFDSLSDFEEVEVEEEEEEEDVNIGSVQGLKLNNNNQLEVEEFYSEEEEEEEEDEIERVFTIQSKRGRKSNKSNKSKSKSKSSSSLSSSSSSKRNSRLQTKALTSTSTTSITTPKLRTRRSSQLIRQQQLELLSRLKEYISESEEEEEEKLIKVKYMPSWKSSVRNINKSKSISNSSVTQYVSLDLNSKPVNENDSIHKKLRREGLKYHLNFKKFKNTYPPTFIVNGNPYGPTNDGFKDSYLMEPLDLSKLSLDAFIPVTPSLEKLPTPSIQEQTPSSPDQVFNENELEVTNSILQSSIEQHNIRFEKRKRYQNNSTGATYTLMDLAFDLETYQPIDIVPITPDLYLVGDDYLKEYGEQINDINNNTESNNQIDQQQPPQQQEELLEASTNEPFEFTEELLNEMMGSDVESVKSAKSNKSSRSIKSTKSSRSIKSTKSKGKSNNGDDYELGFELDFDNLTYDPSLTLKDITKQLIATNQMPPIDYNEQSTHKFSFKPYQRKRLDFYWEILLKNNLFNNDSYRFIAKELKLTFNQVSCALKGRRTKYLKSKDDFRINNKPITQLSKEEILLEIQKRGGTGTLFQPKDLLLEILREQLRNNISKPSKHLFTVCF